MPFGMPKGGRLFFSRSRLTGVLAVHPEAVVARTWLIIGDRGSVHERLVYELAAGTRDGTLFTDEIRCPVHVADLSAALLELASGNSSGIHHVAGPDAVSRHELGVLIARRDGLDASRLPTGLRLTARCPAPWMCASTAGDPAPPAHHAARRSRVRSGSESVMSPEFVARGRRNDLGRELLWRE